MVKKIASLLTVVALILAMSVTAFAAGGIEKIEDGVFVESIGHTTGSSFDVGKSITVIDGEYLPGDTVNIFLNPAKFVGDGIAYDAKTGMSAKEIEKAGVSLRFSSGKNTDVIKDVTFKEKSVNGNPVALIQVKFVEALSSTESKDFEVKITLYANKVKQQDIVVAGTVGGSVILINAGEEFVSLANGEVAEPKENINSIEVDAGKDVSLFAKMYKGKKYYAVVKDEPTDSDIELMNEIKEVEAVYYLDTQGFTGSDVSVKIKVPEKLYVYGEDGIKLGTTDERLALNSKYYLATADVDLGLGVGGSNGSGTDGNTDADLDDTDGPVPGDSDGSSEIPDTGVGVGPTLAVTGVVASVVVIGALVVTGKKKHKK